MKEVMQFDIKQNGLFSAIPYVALCLGTGACGEVADHFRQRGILNTTRTRKLFQSIGGFVPAAFMFATIAFVDCELRMSGVVYLILGVTFSSASVSTFAINPADIAPRFAGEIFGISNTLACFSGIISPNIVGALTPNGTREEWKWVFFITCAIYSFGTLFFLIFASGEVQPWGKPDHLHNEDKRENTDVNPDVHSTFNDSLAIVYNISR
ncbi:sialin-like [Lingula anatina]|uniref:Sialin-like n=1 Tax=Lingula anatina TaxID=7574 RepID=A0A1S3J4P4_LINAN|nr:sialin-like [Lingula anatina]|eukprot:XP_013405236.2 sialin-like [Lingula anatina]